MELLCNFETNNYDILQHLIDEVSARVNNM